MPTTITYKASCAKKLCKNIKLSTGATNTTQFSNSFAASDGFRDSHVNDAFKGVAAWAWTDNSTVPDKTNGTMNVMVVVGKITKNGTLKVAPPIQLTNLAPGLGMAWDTAVAINRTDEKNIVVSWNEIDEKDRPQTTSTVICRAVSFDGGKTWPSEFNGSLIQPTGIHNLAGDCRGVS